VICKGSREDGEDMVKRALALSIESREMKALGKILFYIEGSEGTC
tara:strand:+ start:852 stop:986 length:135 start_codon:yes stop_codon:yes gene_type:complete